MAKTSYRPRRDRRSIAPASLGSPVGLIWQATEPALRNVEDVINFQFGFVREDPADPAAKFLIETPNWIDGFFPAFDSFVVKDLGAGSIIPIVNCQVGAAGACEIQIELGHAGDLELFIPTFSNHWCPFTGEVFAGAYYVLPAI